MPRAISPWPSSPTFASAENVGLLDWYTISIAAFAVVLLAAHGATYLTLKTEGPVHDRSELYARWLWIAIGPLLLVVSLETYLIRPEFLAQGLKSPGSWLGVMVIVASACALVSGLKTRHETRAFFGSNFLIAGLLGTGAATIFPVMLYSTLAPENSLTAYAVASNRSSLIIAAIWWPVAFVLAASYFIFISRQYHGKVSLKRDTQGFY